MNRVGGKHKQISEDISKNHIFELHHPATCDNIGLEVNTMSTAIAYQNSFEVLEEKKEGFTSMVSRMIKLHERYDGLFTAGQVTLALGISRTRLSQIRDRLETVTVKEMGGKEYFTGRGLLKYREEATERTPRGSA